MRKIDFVGDLAAREGRRRAAFVILYARDAPPTSRRAGHATPVCLMLNRSDGQIGFVGGMVEPGETLEAAVRRETREEIGYDVAAPLHPLIAHDLGSLTTHAFAVELRHTELRAILMAAPHAVHFGQEITGVFLPHLLDYGTASHPCTGLGNLLRSALAVSVREELIHLLLTTGIFSRASLAAVCERAGFSLDALTR